MTPQEMRELEEDASNALQESISNGNRLRMTIPADPGRDADLRIAAALAELRAAAARQEAVEALLEVTPVLMYGIPRKPVDVVLADDIRTALATTPEPQQETT